MRHLCPRFPVLALTVVALFSGIASAQTPKPSKLVVPLPDGN